MNGVSVDTLPRGVFHWGFFIGAFFLFRFFFWVLGYIHTGLRVFMDSLQLLAFIMYIIHHTLLTLNFGPGGFHF